MGNTGVTDVDVVGRDELQRCAARDGRLGIRCKIFEEKSGAGSGELPRERASLKIRVSVVRIRPRAPVLSNT